MRAFLRNNGISVFFGVLMLASLLGQSFAGLHHFNSEALQHESETYSWFRYVTSSEFGGDVMENWQSEFLQFFLYVFATVWLIERGSSESKKPENAGLMSDQSQFVGGYAKPNSPKWARARGIKQKLYENSLGLAMLTCFIGSWLTQSVTNWRSFNHEQIDHDAATIGWLDYWGNPDFWNKSLQNWQSEFLAIGVMAVFSVYLRQRGSPESKPVGAPHMETNSND
jgi:hypothetical protein